MQDLIETAAGATCVELRCDFNRADRTYDNFRNAALAARRHIMQTKHRVIVAALKETVRMYVPQDPEDFYTKGTES